MKTDCLHKKSDCNILRKIDCLVTIVNNINTLYLDKV